MPVCLLAFMRCNSRHTREQWVRRSRGACLACEAVVSKAKDRADSRLFSALGREEAEVLT